VTDTAIRVEGLTKSFDTMTALDGIELEIPARTVFGLLGPNGAGKTTTIRILSTILEPDAGRAEVLGRDRRRSRRRPARCDRPGVGTSL
jgi:ABC-type multidrug transport system ATPase subunit